MNIAYELPQVFLSGCTLWSQLNSTTEDIPYQVVGEDMEVLSNGFLSCKTGTQIINLDEVQPGAYYLLLIVGEEMYAASLSYQNKYSTFNQSAFKGYVCLLFV